VAADWLTRQVVYRTVYGHVRDRLERLGIHERDDAIRANPLDGMRPLAPEQAEDPETAKAVAEAIDDAMVKRRPKW
jgi:hypothetical protein